MRIIDPTGSEPPTARLVPAPRAGLRGARIGVLDNGKPNAAHVVSTVARHLVERFGALPPVASGKPNSSQPAEPVLLDRFRDFDAAIVGVGD